MLFSFDPNEVINLPAKEAAQMQELLNIYQAHYCKNAEKDKYYEGNISLNDVNLGIALPDGLRRLEIGCAWGAKAVDVLAARSMFDGFVGEDGNEVADLDEIVLQNNLVSEYMKACRDELKHGCTFATLSKDDKIGCKIRFHSSNTAAASWSRWPCGCATKASGPSSTAAAAAVSSAPTASWLMTIP